MFTNISWTDYIIAVAIVLTVYYLWVGSRYYYQELKELFSGKRKITFKGKPAENLIQGKAADEINDHLSGNGSFTQTTDDDFAEVEELIGKLKDAVAGVSKKNYVAQEFRQFLQLILREYPNIKNSPFRSSINELLVSECEKDGTVTLSEEEADKLWLETG